MKCKRLCGYVWVLASLLCAGSARPQTDSVMGAFSIGTEALLSLERGEEGGRGAFSADGQHFAMAIKHKKHFRMWYDGGRGSDFLVVFQPIFSPDGSRMAYLVLTSDLRQYVMLDNTRIGPYTWFLVEDVEQELVFSSDGKHFAYRTANSMSNSSRPYFVVRDGVEGERYSSIVGPPPTFSQDGTRLAYFARDGEEGFVVLDGVPGRKFARTGDLTGFSADGSRFCHKGQDEDSMLYVVVNDTAYGPYARLLSTAFSPVGNELAWSASADPAQGDTLFVNGQARAGHDRIWEITYSNDGARMAYIAKDKDSFSLVVGDVAGARYKDITCFRFSPDGAHFAYAAHLWPGGLRTAVVMDSLPQYTSRSVWNIVFSPDGTRLASVVELQSGKLAVVVDGVVGPPADSINFVRFSPDSRSCYYSVIRGGKCTMIQDGVEGAPYYRISYDVAVDSASNKLIYFAAKEQDAHVFVVGGQETGAYDYIFGITQFTPQGSVFAFAERDRKVYRLTISPSSR